MSNRARGVVREGQYGLADGRKSNARASTSRLRRGWDVVEVYSDAGISGARGETDGLD